MSFQRSSYTTYNFEKELKYLERVHTPNYRRRVWTYLKYKKNPFHLADESQLKFFIVAVDISSPPPPLPCPDI